jgi:outer membrane biosynthesis protein TonB
VIFEVDETGHIAGSRVYRSSGKPLLDAVPCRVLMRRGQYRPATLNGTAVRAVGIRATVFSTGS